MTDERMEKVPVGDLREAVLDWAVAKCQGREKGYIDAGNTVQILRSNGDHTRAPYSSEWAHGGGIVEDNRIEIRRHSGEWIACPEADASEEDNWTERGQYGPTALVAAMRCYVASTIADKDGLVVVPWRLVPYESPIQYPTPKGG